MKTLKDFLEKDREGRDVMFNLMEQKNREHKELNLTARIRLRQLGCEKELLEKLEILGDLIMDYATEQNRVIKEELLRLKEANKR